MNSSPAVVDWAALCAHPEVQTLIELAIREDVGAGDVTTDAIFFEPSPVRGRVVARTATVACGVPLARHLLQRFDTQVELSGAAQEGAAIEAGDVLFELAGDCRALLKAERTMLNFLMRLCGIAAAARAAVGALPKECRAQIYDTRKTTPGWRQLDKAAVRTGGAQNHRFGLFDAVLIKDNHIAAAGSVRGAIERARRHAPGLSIEVEIDERSDLEEAISAGADIVLLDNFNDQEMARAVQQARGRVALEASGGITLERIPAVAAAGVDRISLGALTHTVRPADLSLDLLGPT